MILISSAKVILPETPGAPEESKNFRAQSLLEKFIIGTNN